MTGGLAVEVVRDACALEALAADWWALWRRAGATTPFQSPAWLVPWWRHFHPGELFTLAVRAEGRLVGLAALYVEASPRGPRLLPLGMSVSDYLDVLVDPAWAEGVGEAFAETIEQAPTWQRLDFEQLRPGAAALALPGPRNCREELARQNACPVLALPGFIDDLARSIPPRQARKLRMARHRAARRQAAITPVGSADCNAFLDTLCGLHGARWQSRGEAGVLSDENVRRFHEQALPTLAEAGVARLYLLSIADRPVGAYYGFLHDATAYAYLGGFDPAFAFESPGTILIGHAIEDAVREGARTFDFLRGREAYKYAWGAADHWTTRRTFKRMQARGCAEAI